MSMGLPAHLIPYHLRRAFARSANLVALVCLITSFFFVLAIQADNPLSTLWPALLAIVLMTITLFVMNYVRTVQVVVLYLFVGTACVFWVAVISSLEFPSVMPKDTYVLTLMRIALIMVGGSANRTGSGVALSAAGLFFAGLATATSARQLGATYEPDVATAAAFLIFVVIQVGIGVSTRRHRLWQPTLHRAARDEQLSAVRYRIEAKAAAMMHDTVLNHLAAVANSQDGKVSADLRRQIERDLEVLVGEEWLLDSDEGGADSTRSDWVNSALYRAVDEARAMGLDVDVSGEFAAVGLLDSARGTAVALAAKQCLVNVLKHSGTTRAELVAYGTPTEVSIMIIDAGVGFVVEDTGADRLGLRQSVRRRIESVGGSVQVWSTPGRGTSVMIRVPVAEVAS
jgi:signal transduction histidine kinase